MNVYEIRSDRLRNLVADLTRRLDLQRFRRNRIRPDDAETWRAICDTLIMDMIDAALANSYAEVRLDNRRISDRYIPSFLSSTLVKTAVTAICGAGYARSVSAQANIPMVLIPSVDFITRISTIRFDDYDIRPIEVIQLKGAKRSKKEKRELIDYVETKQTEAIRAEVERINAYLMAADISVDLPLVNARRRCLHRVFIEDFDKLGRLYGAFWMDLKKGERQYLRINGEPIADLDFVAMFPSLAYIAGGMAPPAFDPYDCPPFTQYRSGVKLIFNALMFERFKQWPKGSRKKFPTGTKLQDVVAAIWRRHPRLKPTIRHGLGFDLTYTESRIMLQLLVTLIERGVPVLPMHDGVMCAVSDVETVQRAMQDSAEVVTGYLLSTAIKEQQQQQQQQQQLLH